MNTDHHFWNWFAQNHRHLRNLRTLIPALQKHFSYWLDWHLHFYAPGLDYLLIFPERWQKEIEMIITANGDPAYFAKVESLVREAPCIKGWKFTAFIQPSCDYEELEQGLDKPYVMQDITLKTSELKFTPFEEDNQLKIHMIVYLKDFTIYSHKKNLLQLIFIMLQDLLGEKVLYESINFVELAQLTDENNSDAICLYELQFYIDEMNRNRKKA